VRRRNLEDLEEFLPILDKILVAIQDNVELKSQHLNLTAKEKLTEDNVQSYKYWLFEHDREDCFENLVDWVEISFRFRFSLRFEPAALEVKGKCANHFATEAPCYS
jgi:hypothetical protein